MAADGENLRHDAIMGFLRGLRTRLGLRKPRPTDIWPWKGISIGRHTYGVTPASIGGYDETIGLTVGSFCSIAAEVHFFMRGNHIASRVTTFPIDNAILGGKRGIDELQYEKPIEVGSDVWIGQRAMIMPGVKIGHGAIVGTASVVTHDVPPYAVAVGVPARIIRYRFPQDMIERLLALRWWQWPDERIIAQKHLLLSPPSPPLFAAPEHEILR